MRLVVAGFACLEVLDTYQQHSQRNEKGLTFLEREEQ